MVNGKLKTYRLHTITASHKHRKHSSVMVGVADRMSHAWIGFNYSLTQAQKTF